MAHENSSDRTDDTRQDADSLPGWSGAGGAVADDVPPGAESSQADPAAQGGGSQEDRIGEIVAQVHTEAGGEGAERIEALLTQRFQAAGLDAGADRIRALAAEIDAR